MLGRQEMHTDFYQRNLLQIGSILRTRRRMEDIHIDLREKAVYGIRITPRYKL
jgi:hypothetical protein